MPNDFTAEILSKILRGTHNQTVMSVGQIMEDIGWWEINNYKILPDYMLEILKNTIEKVIKSVFLLDISKI